jgi:hypothetical protein
MKEFFVLEYKIMDSRGREKNAQFAGVFQSIDDIETAKQKLLFNNKKNISFQVYNHNNIFP